MAHLRWLSASSGILLAAPAFVQAAQYATAEETARRSFPEATAFREVLVQPSTDDVSAVAAVVGKPGLRATPWRILVASRGAEVIGAVAIDSVVGKLELIDYAVAVGADGKIRDVEILAYRESHGYEVKLPAWRRQFVGKGADASLRVGDDIANISGATLSCVHVTDGVRRSVLYVARLQASGRL
jgi:Na+-transporting NADH:ubiquinone oxidoreductase subunit C